jgi:hypothetical protein
MRVRYLPDSSRSKTAAFVLMFVFHAAQVLSKALGMAALANTCWWWLMAYLSCDVGLYLVCKVVRRDFWYWPPTAGVGLSLLIRCTVKVLVDFTACVHFRNPMELGGAYWLFNAAMSQLSCFASVVLYDLYYVGYAKISRSFLYGIVGALGLVWLLSFGTFLLIIKREYRRTFVSMQTGSDYIISYFRDNAANEARQIEIFYSNELMWRSIRPAVKAWVRSR